MKIPYRIKRLFRKIVYLIDKTLLKFFGKNRYHIKTTFLNKVKRLFYKKRPNKFLFILSPPFCGSTLLSEIIGTSAKVSVNNKKFQREGQKLPKVKRIMFVEDRWNEKLEFNWNFIKKEWLKYWDVSKSVLLEKSPPNILRAKAIQDQFKPAYFIVFYRNPYAHCESLLRRESYLYTPKKAAEFAIKCLRYQKENIEKLDNIYNLSYEDLTEKPKQVIEEIRYFLPELSDIKIDSEFKAHNFKNIKMKINNLNEEKISNLNSHQLLEINYIFQNHIDILEYFNYSLKK